MHSERVAIIPEAFVFLHGALSIANHIIRQSGYYVLPDFCV